MYNITISLHGVNVKFDSHVEQFPILVNVATTGHKLQGMSKDIMVVSDWMYSCTNWVYVVLSRVRTLAGLYLQKPIDAKRYYKADIPLIEEERRLVALENDTMTNLVLESYNVKTNTNKEKESFTFNKDTFKAPKPSNDICNMTSSSSRKITKMTGITSINTDTMKDQKSTPINDKRIQKIKSSTICPSKIINIDDTNDIENNKTCTPSRSQVNFVTQESLKLLDPGMWLNDELINAYFDVLEKECANVGRKVYAYGSHFVTSLIEYPGGYCYNNVRRWSNRFLPCDIFIAEKILVPINCGNTHWILACIYMNERKIQIYDSLISSGRPYEAYLQCLLKYLKDERMYKCNTHLDTQPWDLISCQQDTPQQENCTDCGVFVCMFAKYIVRNEPLQGFNQLIVNDFRAEIGRSILQNS